MYRISVRLCVRMWVVRIDRVTYLIARKDIFPVRFTTIAF